METALQLAFKRNEMNDIIINVVVGLVTGTISGVIVYIGTQSVEKNRNTYYVLSNYLYKTMEKLEIEIPAELLHYAKRVGDRDSKGGKAFNNVIDLTQKFDLEDREFTKEEEELANNIIVALKELNAWGVKHHLLPKKK